jgi:dipeptidase E
MKLLLTSNGLSNTSITKVFFDLVDKKAEDILVAFIPTAANTDLSEKGWFINDLSNIKKTGVNVDVVDISALPKENWLPRLEKSNVLFFSGGDTSHLMNWIIKSGLKEELPRLLDSRLYVGISAGSMAATPTITLSNEKKREKYQDDFGYGDESGLGLVDFYFRPHLNSPDSPHSAYDVVKEKAEKLEGLVYALDDNSAVKVDGDNIEVISEGEYYIFNQ